MGEGLLTALLALEAFILSQDQPLPDKPFMGKKTPKPTVQMLPEMQSLPLPLTKAIWELRASRKPTLWTILVLRSSLWATHRTHKHHNMPEASITEHNQHGSPSKTQMSMYMQPVAAASQASKGILTSGKPSRCLHST